jgi:hypothetical protein
MGFWNSELGEITGKPEDTFVKSFDVIPNNTQAPAKIISFDFVEKNYNAQETKLHKIVWKIMSGEFKNREIEQNIYTFDPKPERQHRAKNMLKLIMDLCNFKPTNNNIPMTADLMPMINKILGIKIKEYEAVNQKGNTIFKNWISEVHLITDNFVTETGTKLQPKTISVTKKVDEIINVNDDVPF